MVILLAVASFLTYYFLAALRIANVFTPLFLYSYHPGSPVVEKKSMVVAFFLVALLLIGIIFIKNEMPTYDDASGLLCLWLLPF